MKNILKLFSLVLAVALAGTVWAAPDQKFRFADTSNVEFGSIDLENEMTGVIASSITASAVGSLQIAGGAVTTPKLGTDSVTTSKLITSAVTEPKLATDSVTTDKVEDNAITADKVAFNYAGSSSEGGSATTAEALANNPTTCTNQFVRDLDADGTLTCATVAEGDIGSNAVTTAKIGTDAVTEAKISGGAVTTSKIATDAVGADALLGTGVVAASIGSASESLSITVDSDGRLTSATDQAISITESQISDLDHTVAEFEGRKTTQNICNDVPTQTGNWSISSDDFDFYTSTGTGEGDWRNSRTGIGPC